MTTILIVMWITTGIAGIYIQLQWAYANYPTSRKWLLLRFGSSFLTGAIVGVAVGIRDYQGIQLFAIIGLCGVWQGMLVTFVFPHNMQNVIPKRPE